MSEYGMIYKVEKPVRVRKNHNWTAAQVKDVNRKPEDVGWSEWLGVIGLTGKVSIASAIAKLKKQ